jgi:tetratricopeptide (TPR) repeat protein
MHNLNLSFQHAYLCAFFLNPIVKDWFLRSDLNKESGKSLSIAMVQLNVMIPVYKAIFRGTVFFGSPKSLEQAEKLCMSKLEQVWKTDIAFKPELIFHRDKNCVTLPLTRNSYTEKAWLNTVTMLQTICQFAVSGVFYTWLLDEKGVRKYECCEPFNDKTAVRLYQSAKSLATENPEAAEQLLDQTIAASPQHAQALAMRGFCKMKQSRFSDARIDFDASIQAQENYAPAHHGLALCLLELEEFDQSVHHATEAMKHSIPWMEVYWQARRLKGEALLGAGYHEKSLIELEGFLARDFDISDKNHNWKSYTYVLAAYAYQNLLQPQKAHAALEASHDLSTPPSTPLGGIIEQIQMEAILPLPEWMQALNVQERMTVPEESEPVAFTAN